jgi:hypothetical protein
MIEVIENPIIAHRRDISPRLSVNSATKIIPRKGWAKAAKEFAESGNEETFFPDFFEDEDLSWWQWEQQ